jgi:hypothetical protein
MKILCIAWSELWKVLVGLSTGTSVVRVGRDIGVL